MLAWLCYLYSGLAMSRSPVFRLIPARQFMMPYSLPSSLLGRWRDTYTVIKQFIAAPPAEKASSRHRVVFFLKHGARALGSINGNRFENRRGFDACGRQGFAFACLLNAQHADGNTLVAL